MIGQTLSHYQILEKLGEGGMGVVYKARDNHLDRLVAIKVLPAERVADADSKRRFVQEAKAASALNHPNIVTIYDIDQADGVYFIAMELVAGKPLDRLIPRQGLELNTLLQYGVQVADALATAHAAGIVHRDLKPANLMVTDRGLVKVLDFGLAKLAEAPANGGDSKTLLADSLAKTQEGVILGTVSYMSPEQAEGKPVDARSDIFSLGSVLYEMATGRKAFQGETKVSTLTAILRDEPKRASEIVAGLPKELERIVSRCLRKEPSRRFQHMADVKVELQDLKDESDSGRLRAATPSAAVSTKPRRRWMALAVGALVVVAARKRVVVFASIAALLVAVVVVGLWWSSRRIHETPGPLTLTRLTSDAGLTMEPAISREGKLVAYASDRGGEGNLDIWLKHVSGGEPIRLTRDPADDHQPCFSPDGSQVAFRSAREGGGVYLVSTLGGGPERLLAPLGRNPRFSPDGKWIAYWRGNISAAPLGAQAWTRGGLFVVASTGGASQGVATGLASVGSVVWSPDGEKLLFYGNAKDEPAIYRTTSDWWVVPRKGGTAVRSGAFDVLARQNIGRNLFALVPLATEWIGDRIFFCAQLGDSVNLWRIAISPTTFQVTGPAQRLTSGSGTEVHPSIAEDGTFVFSSLLQNGDIWSLPIDTGQGKIAGKPEQLTRELTPDYMPSVSADGKSVVFVSERTGNADIWLKNLETGTETPLTQTPSQELHPEISWDGALVAYSTNADELANPDRTTYVIPSRGGLPQNVCRACSFPWDWSPDKQYLVVLPDPQGNQRGLHLLNLRSGNETVVLDSSTASLFQANFSPDARWLAFEAAYPGARLYIAPFRGEQAIPDTQWIALTDGSHWDDKPRWSPDGNLLYFTSDRDAALPACGPSAWNRQPRNLLGPPS